MNKHRKNDRGFSVSEMIILCVAGVILMAGGVYHAWLKNSQVDVAREMDRSQRRINDHKGEINSLQVKIDKKLNIYQLRDDLNKCGSRLVLLPVSAIERIPAHPVGTALAVSDAVDSTFAQSSP
jgi:hypothetical protein